MTLLDSAIAKWLRTTKSSKKNYSTFFSVAICLMRFVVPFGTASSYRHSTDLPAQPASPISWSFNIFSSVILINATFPEKICTLPEVGKIFGTIPIRALDRNLAKSARAAPVGEQRVNRERATVTHVDKVLDCLCCSLFP